jgi:enoyl-CoA hydratase/carnithine racemase
MSSGSCSPKTVLTDLIGDHVALVTLNRPAARNAVNGALAGELEGALRATEEDPNILAVVLTGAGEKAFCTGADLKEVAAGNEAALWTSAGGFAGFVYAPRTKVWIAAVNGFALAGGLEIALACDMIVASDDASFGLPEVKRGLIAGAGGLYRLARALPRAIALELVTTGDQIGAARAFGLGLINRVVPKDRLREEALALAQVISSNAPLAVQESLQIARLATDFPERELRRLSDTALQRILATDDVREGARAFVEKRAPCWTGH